MSTSQTGLRPRDSNAAAAADATGGPTALKDDSNTNAAFPEHRQMLWQVSLSDNMKPFVISVAKLMKTMQELPHDDEIFPTGGALHNAMSKFQETTFHDCKNRKDFANALMRFGALSIVMNAFVKFRDDGTALAMSAAIIHP